MFGRRYEFGTDRTNSDANVSSIATEFVEFDGTAATAAAWDDLAR